MAKIVAAYKEHPYPVVIIGHSYGAETALLMAYKLRDASVRVALLVFYDLTNSGKVPSNVDHVLNFRSSSATGIDVTVTGGAHFSGTIENVTRPDLNHLNIDKARRPAQADDRRDQASCSASRAQAEAAKTAKE